MLEIQRAIDHEGFGFRVNTRISWDFHIGMLTWVRPKQLHWQQTLE
jgi:hypothetical protein